MQPFEAPNVSKHTIFINTFIHDDVKEPQSQIFEKFFLPLIKEIEGFTGRRVSIQFIRNLQPYTNFVYENEDHQATANKWKVLALKYRNEKNLPYNKTTKFLLVTKNQLNNQAAGIAGAGQQFGIASLIRELYVGHEIGHMLDASHENGELLYRSGWWCDSYMMPAPTYLTSACHVYTNANRQRISAFLSDAP
ncbi:hypothetical protein VC35_07430 [Pseudomonas fluorescens]|uniref:Peptidase M12B domain-containing protein n=1 Tax=Pseudomonas fluorescens TaxID=294 RepID=A0A0F4TW22_PSEFL|nr:hypothetical protein VC35_07430 [Pseudomonas fluorescens]